MYLSTKTIHQSFNLISTLTDKDEGKTRLEKVSQLRYILALSTILKKENKSTVDLSPNNRPLRTAFVSAVGDVVGLQADSNLYTKDFKYAFDQKWDFSVGSNFLTTVIKNDRDYPGAQRGVAALKIKKENVSFAKTLPEALHNDYSFDKIAWPLAVWLSRYEPFESPDVTKVENAIRDFIHTKFTKEVAEAFNLEKGFLPKLMASLEIKPEELLDTDLFDPQPLLSNQRESTLVPEQIRLDSKNIKPTNLNFIFYGPPGTGKTYEVIDFAVKLIMGKDSPTERVDIVKSFNELRKNSRVEFVTFHQSFGYEDFIEGITPVVVEKDGVSLISYEIKDGILKRFLKNAVEQTNKYENLVLIIDELNRGNLSSIFGELISLLEADKREGALNGIPVTLPYSKEEFILPNNLFIVGTMNSTDRSIALMDFAIRRRFEFIYLGPNLTLVPESVEDIPVRSAIATLNKQLMYLLGKDYQIGQSFFLTTEMQKTEDVKNAWFNKLLPLIGEYFYDDWEKIGLLVPNFIAIDSVSIGSKKEAAKIFRFKTKEEVSDSDFKTFLKS